MDHNQESPFNKWALGIISGAFVLIVSQYYYLTGKVADLDVKIASSVAQQAAMADQLKSVVTNGSISAQRSEAILGVVIEQVKSINSSIAYIDKTSDTVHSQLEARLVSRIETVEKRVDEVSKNGRKGS